jgi:alpha-glucosidase
MKDAHFRDNPVNPAFAPGQPDINRFLQVHSADQPEIAQVVAEMRQVTDSYPDRVLIGEIYLPLARLVAYYGDDLSGVHLPFNFQLLFTTWNADSIGTLIEEYERALPVGAWPNWVLGNHDQKRVATRIGRDQARIAAMLLLTLRGTPTLYYGEELGMRDAPIPADAIRDPWEKREPGLGFGRDPQRTPMQWNASPGAGFSDVATWLPIADDYPRVNVASERCDPSSMLMLYRKLIALRRASLSFREGSYRPLSVGDNVLLYERRHQDQRLLVALYFDSAPKEVMIPSLAEARVLLSTHIEPPPLSMPLTLRPDEGVVFADLSAPGHAA